MSEEEEMAAGDASVNVVQEKVDNIETIFLLEREEQGKKWAHQQRTNRTLFDRSEGLSAKLHATETKLVGKIHNMDISIRERIAKSEKKIAVIVVAGGILIIVVRILLAKVFGISI